MVLIICLNENWRKLCKECPCRLREGTWWGAERNFGVSLHWQRTMYKVVYDVRESSMTVERWDCINSEHLHGIYDDGQANRWGMTGIFMDHDFGRWHLQWEKVEENQKRWWPDLEGCQVEVCCNKEDCRMLMWGIEVAWWSLRELSFWKRRISSSEAE